jgi:hypothetical protein
MRIAPWLLLVALAAPVVARADDDQICADRPTKAYAPCTVPQGRWQVEAGLVDGAFLRQDGVTTDTWTGPEPTLKYGLTDRIDLEADLPLYVNQRTHDGGESSTIDGIGDLTLAAKVALTGSDGAVTAALRPFVKVPTASPRELGDGGVEGGLIAPVQWKLSDAWTLYASPELDIDHSDGGGVHVETVQVAGVQRQLGKSLQLAAELWGDWTFEGGGRLSEASFDLAAAYVIGKDLQLDGGVNLGLNRATPGAEVYVGVSRRF